jgi:hypothetical protein
MKKGQKLSPEHLAKMREGMDRARAEGRLGRKTRPIQSQSAISEDDRALGIGEPDQNDAVAAQVTALLNNPAVASLIDAAVASRLKAMGAPVATTPDIGMMALLAAIEKLTLTHASQAPGYSKPLPSEEVNRRADGFIEMNALLEKCKADDVRPLYRLVNEPLFAGEIEYRVGSEIRTLLYPNEYMQPLDDRARQVHAAMMRWIGGPQKSIGERVAEAEAARRQNPTPESGPFASAGLPSQSPVESVSTPEDERGFDPRRPPQAAHQAGQTYTV